MMKRFALCSTRVVVGDEVWSAAVLITPPKISAVLNRDQLPTNCKIIDVGDAVIMPGLIDAHVHINEPGRTEWEGFETATRAAAAGGITTLIDMPLNSSPVTTTRSALVEKIEASRGKLWVDCGLYAGLIPDNPTSEMLALVDAGVLGVNAP